MKLGRLLAFGLITSQVTLAMASGNSPKTLPELTIYGGNRIPTSRELTNLRINTIKLKVEDNDWKTVLQEQLQITEAGPGGVVSLFIRGSNTNQTLFLIDGMRMSSAFNGAANFAAIAPGLLSSVDVIQGGTSAAFGSNAVGGVIRGNIDIPTGLMVSAGGGSRFSERSAASLGTRGDTYYAGVRVVQDIIHQGSATNKDVPYGVFNPDNDPRKRVGVVAKAGGWITPDFQVEATALTSAVKTSVDASPVTNDINLQSVSMANLRGIYSLPQNFSIMATYGGSLDRLTVRGAYPSTFNTQSLQATVQLEKKLGFGRVFAGMDHEIQKVTSTTQFTPANRTNVAGFIGTQLNTGRHVVEGMFRHDDNSQFGGYDTYSFSLARKLGNAWRLGAITSSSFRAPTFSDLYWPFEFGGFGEGNRNLKPERGRMHEAFISYDQNGASYRLGYFLNDIKDAIVTTGALFRPDNISHARIDGVEFSGIQPIGKNWTVRTNVTGQNPQNEQTHTTLLLRSKVFGTAVLRYAAGNFSTEAIARGEGLRYGDAANTIKLPAMVIVGFSAAYKINRGPTVRVQIDNLLDKKYQSAYGYNGIPRTVWASITHTF